MCLVGGGEKLLGEIAVRIVFRTRAPLFHDHLALRVNLLGIEKQMPHAVGLEAQDHVDTVGSDVDVVGGDVVRGEGIVLTTVPLDGVGELALAVSGRALEHQVLEEVGQPRLPRHLVPRANAVPGLHGDDGIPVILQHEDTQAIVQGDVRDG